MATTNETFEYANNRPHCNHFFLCLKVVGPPGTGKTDVAVQIISNIYHNFPEQRTLIVTHSNQVNPTHNQTLYSEAKLFLEFVDIYIYIYIYHALSHRKHMLAPHV